MELRAIRGVQKLLFQFQTTRGFQTTNSCEHIMKLTRCRVVDNCAIGKQAMAEGRPPKCIHVYNKTEIGTIGDKILVTVKGEMKKAIIVGVKKHQPAFLPRCDSNNIVLIDENGTPLGTRIHVPIPIILRKILKEKTIAKGPDYTKLLALATRFI